MTWIPPSPGLPWESRPLGCPPAPDLQELARRRAAQEQLQRLNPFAVLAHPTLERAVVEKLEKAKDGAYRERNQLAAALARAAIALGFHAGVGQHPESDKEWDSDWRTILYIDLPTGQLSWHFHDSEWPLLAGLPRYRDEYDGHSTAEKYRRLMEWRGGDWAGETKPATAPACSSILDGHVCALPDGHTADHRWRPLKKAAR